MKDAQFRDVEVHSEVLQDGIFDLIDAGLLNSHLVLRSRFLRNALIH